MTRDVIMPLIQRGLSDCGLVCLQMILDRPYDVIRDTALKIAPTLRESGMYASELQKVARALGVPMTYRKTSQVDGDLAILRIKLHKRKGIHYVLWFRGVILNPSDGCAWDAEAYEENKGDIVGVLTVDDPRA